MLGSSSAKPDCRQTLSRTAERMPAGLPGGSKYLLCLAGSNTPSPQPDPYPIQLGYPGINFLQEYAGVYGPDAVRLFRSVPDYVMHHNKHRHNQHLQVVVIAMAPQCAALCVCSHSTTFSAGARPWTSSLPTSI